MVIDPNNSINTAGSGAGKTRQSTRQAPDNNVSKPNKAQTGDSVSLSVAGQNMAKLEAAVAKSPEVDAARVAEAKAAIDSGRYQVNAEALADKLLDRDQDF